MAFNGRFLLNMAFFAARQGGNIHDYIALTGKSYAELNDESCTVDDSVYNSVIERAVRTTHDDFFGLHAGEHLNMEAAGLIVQLAQTSQTVKQAIELCCEFANLGCSALPMKLLVEGDYYKIMLTPNELWKNQSPIAFQHTAEGALAFTIKEFCSLTRMKHDPIRVHVPWPKPGNPGEYERVFGCPVLFNRDEIAILLNKEHVEEPVITSNFNLLKVLITHATEKSAKINNTHGFQSIVKQSIINLVKPDFPTIEQVSAHLNVSSRTLQRKLQAEGTSYKSLTDELRKDFALSYIKRPDLSISEVAYLLSYTDPSAFNRSFKRWTGKTPGEFRAFQ